MKAHVYLADLGLAKVAPERWNALGVQVSTGGRARFGTWDYMAPEQWIRAKDVDPKTDVYSLGILLFQMIAGELPFVADDAKNLMRLHLFAEAPMERVRGRAPQALFNLVGRMLCKTLKERPSMLEVVQRLEMMANAT
jgi:eukaryotic-like serine/threonine-protein kinase